MKQSISKIIIITILLAFITVIIYTAYAHSNGSVNGLTSATSPGCSCHNPTSNSATTLSVVSGTGSFVVDPNSVTTFTITVNNAGEVATGIDIGVKTTTTGEANAGLLIPAGGSGLQNNGGELTHISPKTLVGGSTSFAFTWTAPPTPGTYYLRAIANAVNLNSQADPGDQWNWMPVQAITVSAPPGMNLTSPLGGEQWCLNSSHNITWTSSSIANVMIELSSDGGASFPNVLTNSTPGSTHSWTWNIPSDFTTGSSYKIRISDVSNASINSMSQGNFGINSIVAITSQPQSQTKCTGENATLSVTASGGSLIYKWRFNGIDLPNSNTSNYTIQNLTVNNEGSYDCIISGSCGSPVTSSPASLTVNVSPSISQNPVSKSICVGDGVAFNIVAAASGISYQWRKNGTNIPNANSLSYMITSVSSSDAGQYDCVVNGTCNTPKTSAPATLTINTPAQITREPQDLSICAGGKAKFTVIASGASLQYQWRKDGVNIFNATKDSLVITNISAANTGNYDVIITGTCLPQDTSRIAVLQLNSKPVITQQPAAQTVTEGSNIDFTIIATGSNLRYQWKKNNINIANETTNDIHIINAKKSDEANYSCEVTNDCGTVLSSTAKLTVNPSGPGPVLTLTHTTIDFGTVLINSKRDTIFTSLLKNTGSQLLQITEIGFNPSTADFELISIPPIPLELKVDSTATLAFRFKPKSTGVKNATLEFKSNASSNPVLNLSGIGGVINLSVTDTILTLESTDLNTPVEGSLTLHNNGTIEADVSLEITGTQSSKFKIISPEPTFTIVPGGSEVVVIQFIPKSQNDVTAYLEISNQGDSIPRIIELSGKVSPTSVVESASPLTYFKTYPNPANNLINIEFNLDEPMLIELLVYDNTGNFVKNLGIFSAATQGNKIEWNGLDGYGNPISSGSYNIILRTKKMTKSFRVIFVK